MKTSIFFTLMVYAFIACEKPQDDLPDGLPDCILELIEVKKNETIQGCSWLQSVKRYTFQNQEVYVLEPDSRCITDEQSVVINTICDELCFLGGLKGATECGGVNFYENATNEEIIWPKN